jgi:hypothetical protein
VIHPTENGTIVVFIMVLERGEIFLLQESLVLFTSLALDEVDILLGVIHFQLLSIGWSWAIHMVNHLVEAVSEDEGVGESETMGFHRVGSLW